MGLCAAKPAAKSAASLGLKNEDDTASSKIIKLQKEWEEKLVKAAATSWPKAKYTDDIRSVVWDQIRIRHQPLTENCRNFLVQPVLVRKIPKKVAADQYSDLNPSGELAWYLSSKYNSFSHYLDEWKEDRPSRLAPVRMAEVEDWQLLLDHFREDDGEVGWTYRKGEPDESGNYQDCEALVLPGRHVEWPKVSGAFGLEPQFPMFLMKGSVIKQLDASKPFAIPRHEEAMRNGGLVALSKCIRVRGEEADYEIPDLVRRGISERVNNTYLYSVPIFELAEGRGYLSPQCRIVFISHRWLTPNDVDPSKGHPDDAENTKLKALQRIVKDDDFVFFDLWSIPQAPERGEDRGKAIHSLNIYVDWASEFIALCPTPENRRQYGERGWTNLELVSALTPVMKRVVVNKWNKDVIYGSTCDRIGFLDAEGTYMPLSNFVLLEPKSWKFGHPEDAQAVVPIAQAVKEKFDWMKKALDDNDSGYTDKVNYRGFVNVNQVLGALQEF